MWYVSYGDRIVIEGYDIVTLWMIDEQGIDMKIMRVCLLLCRPRGWEIPCCKLVDFEWVGRAEESYICFLGKRYRSNLCSSCI